MIHNPIITQKIRFIKSVLKDYAAAQKHNNHVFKHNMRLYTQNRDVGRWFADTASWPKVEQDKLKTYLDNSWCEDSITALHIYYLKIKGVNKQHTGDDQNYESRYIYKATVQRLEADFQLLQEAGKEGNHVTSN